MFKTSLAAKIVAITALSGFSCAITLPVRADDIPATPMNHGMISMPTSASAAAAPPPPAAPAEPAMPEKPMKKKKMAKKKMMKKDAMAGGAADGKM